MPYHPHIVISEMAHTFSARAHRTIGIIRCRLPRDVRRRSILLSPSGESMAASFPRERDGVRERELRSARVDHNPSGEMDSTLFPRERIGVPERELRNASVAAHRFRESTTECTGSGNHLRAFPQSAPKKHFHRTSRFVQPATSRCVCDVLL